MSADGRSGAGCAGRNEPEHFAVRKQKARSLWERAFLGVCLTMSYFHTGCRTIIGAESFHGPVRDGKGWFQLAMVIRHDLLPGSV